MPNNPHELTEEYKNKAIELCNKDYHANPTIAKNMFISAVAQELATAHQQGVEAKVDENTSDGYHTFKELYEFRKLYNAALFNEWAAQGKYDVHKSTKHHDGEECFGGGWFIVMATLPTGQISNHYEYKDWGLFKCDVRYQAEEWDGHTAQDVLKRLQNLTEREAK